jgi:hypothetical protein
MNRACRHTLSRHHPRRRVIQYSRESAVQSRSCGVLDTPLSRGMTGKALRERGLYPSNTASAPFTASALSVTVFSNEGACTETFSAKNRASAT